MGVHGLSWSWFLLPVIFSNLGISHMAFGHVASQYDWFPLAMGVSIGVPVVLTLIAAICKTTS